MGLNRTLAPKIAVPLLALAVAVLSASVPVTAQSQDLIVPGHRLGPISLGMFGDEAIKLLGKPEKEESCPGCPFRVWWYQGGNYLVTVDYGPTWKVIGVSTKSTRYASREGLRIGSSAYEIMKAYGQSKRQECGTARCYMEYDDILFWLTGGQITTIVVQ